MPYSLCLLTYCLAADVLVIFLWGRLHQPKNKLSCCFQIKKLLNKPVVRESCYYRKLTDRGKDEPVPSVNEAQIENLLGELTVVFIVDVSISILIQSIKHFCDL